MENNSYKLGKNEAIAIIIIIMINKLILNVPYYIVNLVGSGAIVNTIYIGIIDLIFLAIILKLFDKFESSDILDISEYLCGKTLKIIIGIISIILFFLVSLITLIDFSNMLHTIYFSNFTMIYILLFFIFGIFVANMIGLKSIANSASLIVPILLISIVITFLAVFNNLSVDNITPILGESVYTTFVLGISNSFSLYIIIYFYFLKPLLKEPSDFKNISYISYGISVGILILTIVSMLTLFSSDTGNEPVNSLFLIARQIELGSFIQRVDAIFILLWILSIFSYLSFMIYSINRVIKKLTNIADEKMLSFSTCSILFGLAIIPLNVSHLNFIEDVVYRYIIIGFMFGIGLAILILANIKKRRKKV